MVRGNRASPAVVDRTSVARGEGVIGSTSGPATPRAYHLQNLPTDVVRLDRTFDDRLAQQPGEEVVALRGRSTGVGSPGWTSSPRGVRPRTGRSTALTRLRLGAGLPLRLKPMLEPHSPAVQGLRSAPPGWPSTATRRRTATCGPAAAADQSRCRRRTRHAHRRTTHNGHRFVVTAISCQGHQAPDGATSRPHRRHRRRLLRLEVFAVGDRARALHRTRRVVR